MKVRNNAYRNSEQGHFRCPLRVPNDGGQGCDRGHVGKGKGDQTGRKVSRRKAGIPFARRRRERGDDTQRSRDEGTHACPESCTGASQRGAVHQHQDTKYYKNYTCKKENKHLWLLVQSSN